jgi:hypothetical protein
MANDFQKSQRSSGSGGVTSPDKIAETGIKALVDGAFGP